MTPRTLFGAEPDFGVLRWLGTVLAAGFAWFWMRLFPQITAILAGLIAGPALFAITGCTFFGSCVSAFEPGYEQLPGVAFYVVLSFVGLPATFVWAFPLFCMRWWAWLDDEIRIEQHPEFYAVWSGAIMLVLALIRTLNFTAC